MDPSDATLPFNTGGLLQAGHRYRIAYRFDSETTGSSPPIGSIVSGQGGILIEVHPVPEPTALAQLALAALLVRRRRS